MTNSNRLSSPSPRPPSVAIRRIVLILLALALAASACGNSIEVAEPEAATQTDESQPTNETTIPPPDGEDNEEDTKEDTAPPTTRGAMLDDEEFIFDDETGEPEEPEEPEEKADRTPTVEEPLGIGLDVEEIVELWVDAVRSNDLDTADAYLNPARRRETEGTAGTAALARQLAGYPFTDFQIFGVQFFTDAEGFVETTFTSTTDGPCERWTLEFVMVQATAADAWQIDGHNDYTTECAESMQPGPITPSPSTTPS